MTGLPDADSHPSLTVASATFIAGVAVFLGYGLILAWGNQSPGSPDSLNNLVTARNIYEGYGYTTDIVHQFFIPQVLPGPETVRPPGIPYLLALSFAAFGLSLKIPVLLNLIFGLLSAFLVRSFLRSEGEVLFADVAAFLILFTRAFEPLSIWNNNALVLATAMLLKVGQLNYLGRIRPEFGYGLLGIVAGAGFLFKQSFLFTAVPFAGVLALTDRHVGRRVASRLLAIGIFAITFALTTSPLWTRDLALFGKPVFSDMQPSRLVSRYGGTADGLALWPHGTWWSVRFGRPFGYSELLSELGWAEALRREIALIVSGLVSVAVFNPVIATMAVLGTVQAYRKRMVRALLFSTLFGGVLFSMLYRNVDERYLWPATVPLIAFASLWLQCRRQRTADQGSTGPRLRPVVAALAVAVVWGVLSASPIWTNRLIVSRMEPPEYGLEVEAIVPPDATVITDDPWKVAWYGRRAALLGPTDSRRGLAEVLDLYQPTHYLLTRRHWVSERLPPEGTVPFRADELELRASGVHLGRPWELYRIRYRCEAGDRDRTGDIQLGRLTLYHLSYARMSPARAGRRAANLAVAAVRGKVRL